MMQCSWQKTNCFREPILIKLQEHLKTLSVENSDGKDYINIKTLRKKYSEMSLVYKFILQCLSHQLAHENFTHCNAKLLHQITEALSYKETINYIKSSSYMNSQCCKRSGLNIGCSGLLMTDRDFITKKLKLLMRAEHFQFLKELLLDALSNISVNIISYTFPIDEFPSQPDGLLAVQQHVFLMKEKAIEKRSAVVQQQEYNSCLIYAVLKQLTEYENNLKSLIVEHRCSEYSFHYLQCNSIAIKAHSLKLRYMVLEILCSTYTKESVMALKALNMKLRTKIESTENNFQDIQHGLSQYSNVDPVLKDLFQEYSSLKKDIRIFQSD